MSRRTYAYAVCLVSPIAIFISLPYAISAAVDYRNPLQVKRSSSEPDLATFEAYKAEAARKKNPQAYNYWLEETDPYVAYEAARDARLNAVRFEARRSLVSNSALLLLSFCFFVVHLGIARRPGSGSV